LLVGYSGVACAPSKDPSVMAQVSVWYVRAALLHFALRATTGTWRLVTLVGLRSAFPVPARPLHVEVMLPGWLCQLAVGVAL